MARLSNLSHEEFKKTLQNITLDYLKHRTSGYNLDSQIIAYCEAHRPKIKEENGKIRKLHLHLQISYLNPVNNTKIMTSYYNNSYISDVLDKYVAKKNGLTYIEKIDKNRKKPEKIQKKIDDSQEISFRKKLIDDLKNIKNKEQFEDYCKKNKLEIDIKKTTKNHYIKLIKEDNSTINLRQYEFNHIKKFYGIKESKSKQSMIDSINLQDTKQLEKILHSYYEKRIHWINKRMSKDYRQELEKEINTNKRSIKNFSFQEKYFYKIYQKNIKNFDFKGYFIEIKDDNTKFTNIQKNITIEDKGDEIVSNSKTNSLEEEVALMLEIVQAKGWSLSEVEINGDIDFTKEAEKQIAQKLKSLEKSQKEVSSFQKERPNSEIQNFKKDFVEKQYQKQADTNSDLQKLKTDLNAKTVLDYAVKKYKLDRSKFFITDDNKINNLVNKQKPKNVIDFLQKEINLSTKEAIEICNDLMVKQPKKVVDVVKSEEKLEELVQKHQELQNKDFKVEEIGINQEEEEVKHHSKNKQNKYR